MMLVLALVLAQPAPPPGPVKWVVVDGGFVTVTNPVSHVEAVVDGGWVSATVTNFPATQPVSVATLPASVSLSPDGGTVFDVNVVWWPVYAPLRNPFVPRCNPVRRTGCAP